MEVVGNHVMLVGYLGRLQTWVILGKGCAFLWSQQLMGRRQEDGCMTKGA